MMGRKQWVFWTASLICMQLLVFGELRGQVGLVDGRHLLERVANQRFELYAPADISVDTVIRRLEWSAQQFTELIGAPAPAIAVVLHRDSVGLDSLRATLRMRGLQTLLWPLNDGPPSVSSSTSADHDGPPLLAGHPMFKSAEGGVRIGRAPRGSARDGVDLRPGDVILSINGASFKTARDVASTVEKLSPGSDLRITLERDGERRHIVLPKDAVDESHQQTSAELAWDSDAPPWALFSHEAGHVFLNAYVDERIAELGLDASLLSRTQYGHRAMPDWIDETVAQFSGDSLQSAKWLARMQGDPAAGIPLRELLAMGHPIVAAPERASATQAVGASRRAELMQQVLQDEPALRSWYATTAAFGMFIRDRARPHTMRDIIDGALRGNNLEEPLSRAVNVGGELEALDRAWRDWLIRP